MSNTFTNITSKLPLVELSPVEVDIILKQLAGGSTITSEEPNVVVYDDRIKVLHKSKENKILKVSVENQFLRSNEDHIFERFNVAINPSSQKIYSRPVFTIERELPIPPFRWKDEFQLGRIPDDSPRPDELWSLHPCLFQYKVPCTGDVRLDSLRSREIFKKKFLPLIPFLRQWCTTHIQYDAKTSIKKAWALTPTDEGSKSKWLQLDYFLGSSVGNEDYYPYISPEIKQLPVFKDDPYWLSSINLSYAYHIYENLPIEEQELFLLGCEWFNKAITADERTDQFLFIMIMLEIFLPKESEQCENCGQAIYGINKKFKTYIPEIVGEDWTDKFDAVLGQLYSLRSAIAHNGIAVAQYSGGLIPHQIKQESQLRYLFNLGRQFLVSWLFYRNKMLQEQSAKQE